MKTAGRDPAIDGLPAILLRASCGCAKCRDAASGQRLRSVTDLPADVSVASTAVAGSTVEVVFGPDGHRAVFSREWLADQRRPPDDDRTEDAKRLWAATDPAAAAGLRGRDWPRYLAGPAIREQCLAALMRDGFFLLRNVPCQPEAVLAVAGTMGYVSGKPATAACSTSGSRPRRPEKGAMR